MLLMFEVYMEMETGTCFLPGGILKGRTADGTPPMTE